MKLFIIDHLPKIPEEEFNKKIKELPEYRRHYVMSYRFMKDRILCAESFFLLQEALKSEYGIKEELEFDYIGNHKPILKHYHDIHFNISHCNNGIACAVDSNPVGVDIESIPKELDIDLCHCCFNDAEFEDIMNSDSPNIKFAMWWTKKEAFMKLTGQGMVNDVKNIFSTYATCNIFFETSVNQQNHFVVTWCQYPPYS